MEILGTIKQISETQTFSKGFQKRDLIVVTDDEKYPQILSIEFYQDKVAILDTVQVGQKVNVGINLAGREYTKDGVTRYFNTIKGWRVDPLSQPEKKAGEVNASSFAPDREKADLPF